MTITSETRFVRISIPNWQKLCLSGRQSTRSDDSRRGGLGFWMKPTDHGGFYHEVLSHPLGMAVYGFWCAFVDLVLNQPPDKRGSFVGFRGRSFQLSRLAQELGTQASLVVSAVDHLASIGAISLELECDSDSVGTESDGIGTESAAIGTPSLSVAFRPVGLEEGEGERELTTTARSDSADAEITSEPKEQAEPNPNRPPTEPLARWPSWWDPGRVAKGQRVAQAAFVDRFPELLAEWRQAFPALDVVAELAKAHAWEIANPGRRKTPRGRARFLHGWLERCQDRGGGARNGSPASAPPAPNGTASPPRRPPWLVNCPMGACEIRPGDVAETTFGRVEGPFPHGGWYRHKGREVHRWTDAAATRSEPVQVSPAATDSRSARTRDGPPGLRGCAEGDFEASGAVASRNGHPIAGDGQ